MKRSADGFTIIEVILFLGISSLLLVGAFVAMKVAISNTQFNDTADTTLSYFQKQYLEVATGVNIRDAGIACNAGQLVSDLTDTTAPGTSNCVILGRLLTLNNPDASNIETRYLSAQIANVKTVSDLDAFDSSNYQAKVSTASALSSNYELPWLGIIKKATLVHDSTANTVKSVAILRSPVSERMLIYAFPTASPASIDFTKSSYLVAGNQSLVLCIQSDEGIFAQKALLKADPGQGQDLFTMDRSGKDLTGCNT